MNVVTDHKVRAVVRYYPTNLPYPIRSFLTFTLLSEERASTWYKGMDILPSLPYPTRLH